ncbi:MAG: hypothetical protein KDA80_10925 [Planctomycetaceae bacterium]|nr:hypothetical protein [Planctomycetaceae bacterium]
MESFDLPLLAVRTSSAAVWTFLGYTVAVFVIAAMANRLLQGRHFLSEYFLGSRGLGVWAFALTFAATSASGGTFTGFPAKIYTHGWILALWIASYMVYPICTMGFLGKRINQVARKTGAITVPDVLRDRFDSRAFGLISTVLIIFFLGFNLVAQFKAGSVLLQTLLQDSTFFRVLRSGVEISMANASVFEGVNAGYLTCLLLFGIAVIFYTTYGGFHAVVWTDVMQGIVMVVGIIILLPLVLSQVGGMNQATHEMARMLPPRLGTATIVLPNAPTKAISTSDLWFRTVDQTEQVWLYRLSGTLTIPEGVQRVSEVKFVGIRTPEEIARQMQRFERPYAQERMETLKTQLIEAGVPTTRPDTAETNVATWPPTNEPALLIAELGEFHSYAQADQPGQYVMGPAPNLPSPEADVPASDAGFLPLGLAISFFFMWAISGTGQPQYMVRLMAFKDAKTLRSAIIAVTVYYGAIYFPLVIIFCYARILLPGMENEADKIMPALAVTVTENAGHGWLAGFLIAAPFAAVMSTVDSYLLVISSAVVRDVYQRNVDPDATEKTIKRLSYATTLIVGSVALAFAINPPRFLQDIIVYVGSGLAACFLVPVVAALYWPRANLLGCLGAMLGGFGMHLLMHLIGWQVYGEFTRPYDLFGFSPVIVGLGSSLIALIILTPLAPPPREELVRRYFCKGPSSLDDAVPPTAGESESS